MKTIKVLTWAIVCLFLLPPTFAEDTAADVNDPQDISDQRGTCSVTGKVVNPDGTPIAIGVLVQAFDGSGNFVNSNVSNGMGRFQFFVDNSLGAITLTYTQPVGYPLSTYPPPAQYTETGISVTGSIQNRGQVKIPQR